MVSLGIIAVLVSMLAGVISALASKKLAIYFGKKIPPICTVGIGTLPMAIGVLVFGLGAPLSPMDIALSVGSGLFLAVGFMLRYKSMYTEQVTNISVLGQAQTAIIVLVGLFSSPSPITLLGIPCIILNYIGALFELGGGGVKINMKLVPTLFSSASWGVYWVMIIAVVNGTSNFLLPLLLARIIGTLVLLVVLWTQRSSLKEGSKTLSTKGGMRFMRISILFAVITGLFNGIGDALFGVVTYFNIAAIGSALNSAIGLVIISVISYFAYNERLTRMEWVGFVVMMAGAFVLSVYGQ